MQRSIISIAAIVSSREGALPFHCIHASSVLEKQAHNGLMTSTCCHHERSVAFPAHKRMRREQPQNNATQHHQHCSHRQQQRREDMGCSAQGVQLPVLHIHRPCISNYVQLNSFNVAASGSMQNTRYPSSCDAASRLRLQKPTAPSAPQTTAAAPCDWAGRQRVHMVCAEMRGREP